MLDSAALQQLVEKQIQKEVTDKVTATLTQEWADRVEDNTVKFIQDRIVAKFANSAAMPELVAAVKSSVKELFASGHMPGLGQYVDYDYIKKSVDDSTQLLVQQAINELTIDPTWLEKIENSVNQTASQRVLARLNGTDIRPIVQQYVDSIVKSLNSEVFKGIQSRSDKVELTVLDDHVVVEKQFTAKDIEAVDSLTVKNLIVKGTVNTDNHSWNELSDTISEKAFEKISADWQQTLVQQVRDLITEHGIDFKNIKVDGELLVDGNRLSSGITESQLQSVGKLKSLTVSGNASLSGTMNVSKNRVGINTDTPEMALSLWDEEVAVVAGKFKSNVGYIGTARKQGLVVGINKTPVVEIDENGLTAIKQLQVGIHRISHASEVPGYSGTKGDIVFNSTPTVESSVFAWQCLGGYRWKVIKAVE